MILVREIDPPESDTPVEWLLLTTLPLDTAEDLLRVIDHYAARWTIKVYFRMLKTGCRVEQMPLETKSRQLNCLAFDNIIAWKILSLTGLNRVSPQISCAGVFADHEWKSVWRVATKQPLPTTPPTLTAFVRLLAQLGGDNNRRQERPPGPQPLWIGVRRMLDYANAWLTFGPETNTRCV